MKKHERAHSRRSKDAVAQSTCGYLHRRLRNAAVVAWCYVADRRTSWQPLLDHAESPLTAHRAPWASCLLCSLPHFAVPLR